MIDKNNATFVLYGIGEGGIVATFVLCGIAIDAGTIERGIVVVAVAVDAGIAHR